MWHDLSLNFITIRDLLPSNPKEYMKQLAEMGYKYFESYSKDRFLGNVAERC